MVHSGRHATYGSPKYSGIHWHAAALVLLLQTAFEPQGEGLHGSITSVGAGAVSKDGLQIDTFVMRIFPDKKNINTYLNHPNTYVLLYDDRKQTRFPRTPGRIYRAVCDW